MSAFRCLRVAVRPTVGATAAPTLFRPSIACRALPQRISAPPSTRSISLLSARRPIIPATASPSFAVSTTSTPNASLPSPDALDLSSKISSHPALGSIQIRCGPRDTYNPSHLVRKRRHGFLSRLRTKKGRKLLMRRIKKGRWNLSH